MNTLSILLAVSGAAMTGLVVWLYSRGRHLALRASLQERERQATNLRSELDATRDQLVKAAQEREHLAGVLEAEQRAAKTQADLFGQVETQFRDAFAATASQALHQNNQAFLDLAKSRFEDLRREAETDLSSRQQSIDSLVKPVREGLQLVGSKLQELSLERTSSQASVQEHLRLVMEAQGKLTTETQTLVKALRTPQVRGQWGELQLHRVVELAGMVEHCDFVQQVSIDTDDGRLRPDMVVRLPGRKLIVVDSKAPLSAYLDAAEAQDEDRRGQLLDQHASQVRAHIVALSSKDYANQFEEAPDFVVLFLPGESFFSAACQRDPSLIEFAVGRGVIPASPTTLITVLKAVAYGWQQDRIAANAEQIRDLGQTLYERISAVAGYLAGIRKGLEGAVGAYNKAIGSWSRESCPRQGSSATLAWRPPTISPYSSRWTRRPAR